MEVNDGTHRLEGKNFEVLLLLKERSSVGNEIGDGGSGITAIMARNLRISVVDSVRK